MASLYIRNLSDALVKAVRIKALQEDTSIDKLLAPFLEMAVNSKPVEYVTPGLAEYIAGKSGSITPELVDRTITRLKENHATQTKDVEAGPHAPQGVRPAVRQLERSPQAKESHGINCRCFQCRKK